MQTHVFKSLIFFISVFLIIPSLSFASVGTAKMVLGKVMIAGAQGDKKRLRRGGAVNVGDTVITSKRGQAQLTMIDGTKISVRPGSEFQIEAFVATGKVEEQKTYYKLLKGGFRSVTGQIGKKNKSSFRLSTPVATMGIRGTDFTGKYCADDCPSSGKNGLFVDVISGSIAMTNDGGTFELDRKTNGYVSDANQAPESIAELPANLLSPKAKHGKKRKKYPSPEEEMVQVGLYVDPDNKAEILSEAMDAGMPPAQIMRGADNAGLEVKEFLPQLIKKGKERGMDPSDFVAPILKSGIDADSVIEGLISANPSSASDILTAAIATGEFDNDRLKSSALSAGVSSKEIDSADTVGNLFALPPEVKKLLKKPKSRKRKDDDDDREDDDRQDEDEDDDDGSHSDDDDDHESELNPGDDREDAASPA